MGSALDSGLPGHALARDLLWWRCLVALSLCTEDGSCGSWRVVCCVRAGGEGDGDGDGWEGVTSGMKSEFLPEARFTVEERPVPPASSQPARADPPLSAPHVRL